MGVRAKVKTSSPKVLNAWLLFGTILVIVLSFFYYSFVYVKNNEKDQIAKRFRALAQIGKNIANRKEGFEKIAETARERARELKKIKEIEEILIRQKREADRKKQEEDPKKILLGLIQEEIQKANELLKVDERNKKDKEDQDGSFQRDRLIVDTWDISFEGKDGKTDSMEFYIYVSVNDFFKSQQRPDVFDGLLIIQEEKNISKNSDKKKQTEEKKETVEVVGKVLYHTFPGDIDISHLEKLKNSQHGIESGCLKDIKISTVKYKLFLQPVTLDNGKKWYVGGLTDDKEFRGEARRLKSGVLTPLLIVFFIFILSIPLLKLFLMSKFEQMDISDVVLTTISVNFGTIALLILCIYTFQVRVDTAGVNKNLSGLARQIKKNFTEELKEICEELRCFDSRKFLQKYHLNCGDNFKDILTGLSPGGDDSSDERSETFKDIPPPLIYPFFKVVFWMDSSGQQKLQFSTRNYGGRLINVKERRYFQESGNWRVPGDPDSRFMLESITSLTSGENLAAVSMKSGLDLIDRDGKGFKVDAVAMTTQLTSVIDTIMPAGYGFCIMDKTGKAWFHSNTQRNLQENFINEAENDNMLLSAIAGNLDKPLALDYQNLSHRCFIMPVPDIPLYIVTFHDVRYTSGLQSTIVLHIVVFAAALALFTGLLFIVAACCNYTKSLLKRKHVPFEWFKPLNKNKEAYQHLILSNLVIVLVLILFKIAARTQPLDTFFFCISALLYSFTYNYFTITQKDNGKYRLKNYRLLFFFLSFLFLVEMAALFILKNKIILLILFQGCLLFGLGLVKMKKDTFKPFDFIHSGPERNWIRSYVLFLLSWLLVVSVIPVILYYPDVHSYENKVALKHFQVKMAEDIEDRNFRIDRFYHQKISKRDDPLVLGMKAYRKKLGVYANIIGETRLQIKDEDFRQAKKIEDNNFNNIAYIINPPLNRVAAERRAYVFPAAADGSYTWKKDGLKLLLKYQKKNSLFHNNTENKDDRFVDVVSDMGYFKIPLEFFFLLFAAAIFLQLVYFLVRFAARIVFGSNLPGLDKIKRTYIEAQDEIGDSLKAGANVIIYCPGSIEMKCCETALRNGNNGNSTNKKIIGIDLKTGSETLAEMTESSVERLVLLKNFEPHRHGNDIDKYLNIMNRAVSLSRTRNVQVAILSSIPLEEIVEFYEEKYNEVSAKDAANTDKEMKPKYREIIDILNEVNEWFTPFYLPLKTLAKDRAIYPEIEKIKDDEIRDLVKEEFQEVAYFKRIENSVYKFYENLGKKFREKTGDSGTKEKDDFITEAKEEMIIKIQELAQQYYNELLSSCSKKERYILYDIAQDMFLNVNNREAIDILLKKGLLVYKGEFKLLNESFRNFILCSLDPDELKQYVRILYPRWRSYKAPLLLIALGAAVFLALQEDLLGNVDALITTAVGGIAIVTNFSRLFMGYSKKRAAPAAQ